MGKNTKRIAVIILLVLVLPYFIFAQEKEQKIELKPLTLEQKWNQAENDLIAFVIAGIAYAKSKGETASEYGEYVATLFSKSWKKEQAEKRGCSYLVKGIHHNFQQFEKFQMEILKETDKSITAKMSLAWKDRVQSRADLYGVTVEEVNRFFGNGWSTLAKNLGLDFNYKIEGDWMVFTVTEKK